MGKVITQASMSLDGYIADPEDRTGPLFDWLCLGDVEVVGREPDWVFDLTPASAEYLKGVFAGTAVMIIGRRLFDLTNGWGGRPPVADHVFVITHHPPEDWPYLDAPFTFVTDGLAGAVARAKVLAGDRDVAVGAGSLAGQALREGLIDEVLVDLVPVIIGSGIPFFSGFHATPVTLDDPVVIPSDRVTHLRFRVSSPM
ncbi:dihydrofolate reductase family protein [Herbidospora sp. RD11066]